MCAAESRAHGRIPGALTPPIYVACACRLMHLADPVRASDLDTLQKWVTELFSEVPNQDRPPAEVAYAGKVSPVEAGSQERALAIVPLEDARSMLITWQLPFTSKEDRLMRLKSKPQNILGAVVGYEGKGSLAAYLKGAGMSVLVGLFCSLIGLFVGLF